MLRTAVRVVSRGWGHRNAAIKLNDEESLMLASETPIGGAGRSALQEFKKGNDARESLNEITFGRPAGLVRFLPMIRSRLLRQKKGRVASEQLAEILEQLG